MANTDGSTKPIAVLQRGLGAAIESVVLVPIVSFPVLPALIAAGPPAGRFAAAAYAGIVASLAGYVARENPKRVKNIDEPEYVNTVRTVVIMLYFNTMVFTAVTLGFAFTVAGYGEIAFVAAALFPAVDATLARYSLPSFGLAGLAIIKLAEVLGTVIGRVISDSDIWDGLEQATDIFPDIESLYGEYGARLDETARVWR